MAFRSVGDLAVEVLVKAKTAAHADKLRMNLGGDEPVSQGGGPSPSPIAAAGTGGARTELRKGAEAETPAQLCPEREIAFRDFTGSRVKQSGELHGSNEHRMVPVLPMSRNMRVTSPNGLPRPVARIFLVTIDGVCVHLPPAHAAMSGSARASSPKAKTMIQSF